MNDDPTRDPGATPATAFAAAFATTPARTVDPLRRRLLRAGLGGVAFSALPAFSAFGVLTSFGTPALAAPRARPASGFTPIAAALDDAVRVPEGYAVQFLHAWGDPLAAASGGVPEAGGAHHGAMQFLPFVENGKPSPARALLCVNHEGADDRPASPGAPSDWSHARTLKAQNAHGVSLAEIERAADDAAWRLVRPSSHARRVTARTPLRIAGPAAGAPAMCTKDDRRGHVVFGTLGNQAMALTPWGTCLSGEAGFAAYFNGPQAPTPEQARYGLRAGGAGHRWHEHDSRFDVATEPNEPNRFGWMVEVDPWNPGRPPVKRTALGRIAHRSAAVALARDGRVVVYMGDDGDLEALYKFVSRARHDAANPAANAGLLDSGTLYVARFGEAGEGEWLPLEHGAKGLGVDDGFADQADVLIRARQAADRIGATRMDRPLAIAVHPETGEVYCVLSRSGAASGTGSSAPASAAPDAGGSPGRTVRWREEGGDAGGRRFTWQSVALGGSAFVAPDDLHFDARGRLWVRTGASGDAPADGGQNARGNGQLRVAEAADGAFLPFLGVPKGAVITGIAAAPDGRSLFVNIQHSGAASADGRASPQSPGAAPNWPASQFPQAVGDRSPRSATVVVTRRDGGEIGG